MSPRAIARICCWPPLSSPPWAARFSSSTEKKDSTHGGADAGYLRRVQLEHRRIFEAIRAGSAVGARNAMRAHLINSRTRHGRMAASYARARDDAS